MTAAERAPGGFQHIHDFCRQDELGTRHELQEGGGFASTPSTPRVFLDAGAGIHANEHTPPQVPATGCVRRPRRCSLRAAHAQSYPTAFVRLIVPFPTGLRRLTPGAPLAQRLSSLGPSGLVENRGGAGGNVGSYQAANAAARRLHAAALLCLSVDQLGALSDLRYNLSPTAPDQSAHGPSHSMMVSNSSPAHSFANSSLLRQGRPGKATSRPTGYGASAASGAASCFKRMAGIE